MMLIMLFNAELSRKLHTQHFRMDFQYHLANIRLTSFAQDPKAPPHILFLIPGQIHRIQI
jgi:hypothetical protein